MFKSGHEYHKYCKCTEQGNTAETMCEFCKRYSKLRYYKSLWNNNKIKDGGGMHITLTELETWYFSITGKDFESPGRGKKPYVKEESTPKTISVEEIQNSIKEAGKTIIIPDTFEFANNKITIKDSRDIKSIIINLSTREIWIANGENCKYSFDGQSVKDLYKASNKLSDIKKILEEK